MVLTEPTKQRTLRGDGRFKSHLGESKKRMIIYSGSIPQAQQKEQNSR